MKQWVKAAVVPSGVRGDGARGQISRGTRETRWSREEVTRPTRKGEDITPKRLPTGVGEAHSVC